MNFWTGNRVFLGMVLITMVWVSVIYLIFNAALDERHYLMNFNSNKEDNPATFPTINCNVTMAKNSSREEYVPIVLLKQKCYHLNWNESALTQDVYSKCGFITFKEYLGRTGNHMFEVAALFGTAHDLDLIPVISPSCPLLEYYNLPNVMNITLTNIRECEPEKAVRTFTACSLSRTHVINLTMDGYRQSWKYFKNIEDSVAKIFRNQFKNNSLLQAANFIKQVSNSSLQNVGMHIRRSDMHSIRVNKGQKSADMSYLHRAMSFFKIFYEQVQFIVITDDIEWAKEHLQSGDIFYSPFTSPGDDLALMSLCDHMIITFGTFGWWGSWLANGTTVFLFEERNFVSKVILDSDYNTIGSIGIE